MINFWVNFDHFWSEIHFLRQLGSSENWLELKMEPPLANLACLNQWNTLYEMLSSNIPQKKASFKKLFSFIKIFIYLFIFRNDFRLHENSLRNFNSKREKIINSLRYYFWWIFYVRKWSFSKEKCFNEKFVFLFLQIYVFAFPIFPLSILKALERVYVKRWC